MVDRGSRKSVICADLVRGHSSFNIHQKNWRSLDGNVLAVVGETNLKVRYSGETIDLKQVLVMENAAHPLVLGMDWIGKAGAIIYVEDEKPVVNVSKKCKEKMRSPSVNREKEEIAGDDASKERTEQEFVDGEKKSEIVSVETNNSFEKAADQLLLMVAMVEDEVIAPKREQKTCIRLKGAKRILVECPVC
ncbi:hypothetical protein DAPPUDRAFT_321931 [Daphnia pulex]|uniref:Uncharacterized protein n=1 Tax=Daphnia pulex TaxID=6669 RepID=E9GUL2_DAPPU|nr:hypothetical protein DAPPUDRAFT_321931 [Daphnia pulex]|eukprot:EFX76915.1 hypothetical protein DAPPUDRAFT_321931 [Daphnia pulex]